MSTRKDQLLRRAAGNERSRAVAITREEKALRAVLESAGGGTKEYILSAQDFVYGGGSNYFVNAELFDSIIAGKHPVIWIDSDKSNQLKGYRVLLSSFSLEYVESYGVINLLGLYSADGVKASIVRAGVFRTQEDWLKYANDNELL